jgi:hypothetical protein
VDTRLTPRAGAFAIYEKATAMPFTRPRRWVRWLDGRIMDVAEYPTGTFTLTS